GLLGDARALLGGNLDAAASPMADPPPALARLVRIRAPDAHPIFTDTPLVPIQVWQPLQAKRVRYFFKPAPQAPASAVSSSTGSPPREPASGDRTRRRSELLARDPAG